ncbi:stomatin-like protein 3 isoform X2 [Drosophila tropicalis]|uniref:stomatin-like protein 3 isoform X2 n=1 Tax=Drosophila tropicalis TaxID=46794 RepID=UPI0035AC16A7
MNNEQRQSEEQPGNQDVTPDTKDAAYADSSPPPTAAAGGKTPAERPFPQEQQPDPNQQPKRFIKTTEDEEDTIFEKILYIGSIALAIIFFPIAFFLCIAVVKEHERLVVFRLGRVRKGILGPGISWVLPCIDSWINVDMRTICEVVPSQDILTKDSVTIRVDAVLYYCIYSPMDAVIQVANVYEATMMIAQTTLRTIVGSKSLIQLLTSREALSREIGYVVDGITARWGVRVERVELKDIRLPESLQRSLASEAEAHREARAKIISAEGELKASQALKDASDVMAENKITLQLRHLQILTSIASERQCHIIYPFPMEMMTPFEKSGKGKSGAGGGGGGGGAGNNNNNGYPSFLPFFGAKEESPLPPPATLPPPTSGPAASPNSQDENRKPPNMDSQMDPLTKATNTNL